MQITVLKFKRVLSHRQSKGRLMQYAPCLWQGVEFKALQIFAAIWKLEHDEELITREDIYSINKSRTAHHMKKVIE